MNRTRPGLQQDAVDCVHFCLVAIRPGWILDFAWSPTAPILAEAVHGYISTIKLTCAGLLWYRAGFASQARCLKIADTNRAAASERRRSKDLPIKHTTERNVAACKSRASLKLICLLQCFALHYSRNQLATPRRWLPHVTASYTLNAAGKRRIGKRNNAVLRKYYDVVAMTPDVVALRPKPSTNETWDEDLAAARRDPC